MKLGKNELKEFLDEKYERFNNPKFIESDPIFVPQKEDMEIAASFSATFAWGQRPTIIRNGLRPMKLMDNERYHGKNTLCIVQHSAIVAIIPDMG